MRYVRVSRIIRYPDGSIKSPQGDWRYITHNQYQTQNKFMYTRTKGIEKICPLTIYDIRAGVLSKSMKNNIIISLPILNLQFSVSPDTVATSCNFGKSTYEIVQSLGGYLISIDVGSANWRGPWEQRNKRSLFNVNFKDKTTHRFYLFTHEKRTRHTRSATDIWEFSSSLKTTTDYAQLRYEQTFVIKQINRNFGLLQKNICEVQYQRWLNLYPPNLAQKVANYISGDVYSIGEPHFGSFRVQFTVKSTTSFSLCYPIVSKLGMYKVKGNTNNQELWAEPVTGILFLNPQFTHYSLSASWLPGTNGSGIIPHSGELLLPEITMDHLKTIHQIEAFSQKPLYSSAELAGVSDEFQNYRSKNILDKGPLEHSSWLTQLFTNTGISLLIGLGVAILVPPIITLARHILRKGEEKLEESLHLTHTKDKKRIINNYQGGWGLQ